VKESNNDSPFISKNHGFIQNGKVLTGDADIKDIAYRDRFAAGERLDPGRKAGCEDDESRGAKIKFPRCPLAATLQRAGTTITPEPISP